MSTQGQLIPVLHLPENVTFKSAMECQIILAKSISDFSKKLRQGNSDKSGHAYITLDAQAIKEFDSSVLAVLLECHRLVAREGLGLVVSNVSAQMHELAKLYGVDKLLFIAAA